MSRLFSWWNTNTYSLHKRCVDFELSGRSRCSGQRPDIYLYYRLQYIWDSIYYFFFDIVFNNLHDREIFSSAFWATVACEVSPPILAAYSPLIVYTQKWKINNFFLLLFLSPFRIVFFIFKPRRRISRPLKKH